MPTAKVIPLHSPLHSPLRSGSPSHETESDYQILFDQASDAILTIACGPKDAAGHIEAANQAAEELTGYVKSELRGGEITLLTPDPARNRIPERARCLTAGVFAMPGTYEDIAILRKDGYVRMVDLSVRLVSSPEPGPESTDGESGYLAIALFRDVTEKKRMERELITKHAELRDAYFQLEKKNAELQALQETLVQAGKMAALGELAAGIAHELNQPLQGIRGYAQELQALIVPPSSPESASVAIQASAAPEPLGISDTRIYLKEVISNVDKMAAIIDYLRAFTRKSVEKHELTDVHHVIEEALKMLDRQFKSRGIAVERRFQADLPKVYANPLQLEQVFINLATNARDAIEASGKGSGNVIITTRASKGLVEVLFRDDGCGMSERTKTKAFNPFFTTKEVGKGMGLGLSLSYGMISKLHGSIVVESEVGRGTEFLVRLPVDFRELA